MRGAETSTEPSAFLSASSVVSFLARCHADGLDSAIHSIMRIAFFVAEVFIELVSTDSLIIKSEDTGNSRTSENFSSSANVGVLSPASISDKYDFEISSRSAMLV